ncbi:hypothetical protein AWB70_01017 [Caballeronia cordobensis]|uniref:Uncharacterized protein n=2 Tax=Caballeronia cordobensis TaxID=1353886 RepID=A0A158FKI4_CABCO|nr:hypothetical protein AWB70_01017 [Caballeronia cordobensis]
MTGDTFSSCAECLSPCERSDHASGITGNTLKFEVVLQDKGAKLFWACPGCGKETCEKTGLLSTEQAVAQIEADPLCFTCRTKQPTA